MLQPPTTLRRYADLHALADGRPPLWWDEGGVPRWTPFDPRCGRRLASEVALLRLDCACRQSVLVALSSEQQGSGGLIASIAARRLPQLPAHEAECCAAGALGFAEAAAVEQAWRLDDQRAWQRVAEVEGPLPAVTEIGPSDLDAVDELTCMAHEAWLAGVRAERHRAATGGAEAPPSPAEMLAVWIGEIDEADDALCKSDRAESATTDGTRVEGAPR
jgi:hypothetical protein